MNYLLVTGGSAGIGAATAQRFSDAGHAVINLSRRPCPVTGVIHLACDLADPGFGARVAPELSRHLAGATTVTLVHNAARMAVDSAATTESAALRAVLEVNVIAPNTLNRLCLPLMKPGSAIIYVGSTLSEKAVPDSFSYVTSKHAAVGMMRATCQDLAGTGIHTVCVCPGFTNTDMLRSHVPPEALEAVRTMQAFGRLVEPEEIAEVIHWAATNAVVNGSVIHASLGQVER